MCDWLCGGAFESAAHAEELQISQDEAERKVQKPGLSPAAAEDLLQFHFGDDAQIDRELDSYDDQNFLALVNGERCVFKVLNGVESFNEPLIEAQSALLRHLAGGGIRAPIEYAPVVWVRVGRRRYALRLLKWVAGAPLCTLDVTPALLRRSGAFLGRVRATLDGFDAAALHRCHAWDPRRSLSLEPFASRLRAEGCDAERAGDVRRALQSFRTAVEPMSHGLGMALLHGDYNDANVLVPENGDDWGILDIGDAVYSWRVGDVAIGLAYCLVTLCSKGCDAAAVLEGAFAFLDGVATECTFTDADLFALPHLAACRLATSFTLGWFSYRASLANDPGMPKERRDYLLFHAMPAATALRILFDAMDSGQIASHLGKYEPRLGSALGDSQAAVTK